ncbi:methyltransferase domain-containing protein [Dyella telluris]|uniref:Methyltransferase domain-containing protein n=1 Tax=Dyella telluris TaxID=2763498 RepID=A0A7G8Q7I3_9GAMM|nr:methyltransferase domain-containing protein [Dyella telluris]QNK02741.1 methyltransferase domain-containing protein [Dyella telluris]
MVNERYFDVDTFSISLRDAFGFGRYLCLGSSAADIAAALRGKLIDARTRSSDDGIAPHAVVLDLRGGVDDGLAQLPEIFKSRVRYVVAIHDIKESAEFALREREALERRIITIGYRKAAAYYDINPYASLNEAHGCFIAPFERVPDAALGRYNLEILEEERLLHTDMLRETGRRSDAHCVRYRYAAEYIRPGDRVLDVACGLGYGSRMLFEATLAASVHGVDLSDFGINYANAHYGLADKVRFSVGDAEVLGGIADASIDFIAAFETIEHVPHPERYLAELKRVLAPGGRVMLCAPNDWTDETGRDPNPFHLHVYTWEKLKSEVSSKFLLEKAFIQVAGGAMKCHFSPRSWQEVDPSNPEYEEAEWVVFLGMKDPTEPAGATFKETAWEIPSSSRFNVSAFARDYLNPWLVKSMVAIGLRSRSPALLDRFRRKVFAAAPALSVDAGAALCGLIYEQIERGDFSERDELKPAVDHYLAVKRPSPHQRRWQVSIAYAWGFAEFLRENIAEAERYFRKCSAIDPVPYSPILGNKTLDALFLRAVLCAGRKDFGGARVLLQKSIGLVRRWSEGGARNTWLAAWLNVAGSNRSPLPFGLAEMAILFDKSARAAYMLAVIDSCDERPGAFAREARGFLERQIDYLKSELRTLNWDNRQKTLEALDLNAGLQRLKQHADTLADQLLERDHRVEELAGEVVKQSDRAQELAAEVIKQDKLAQDLARQVMDIDAHAQSMGKNLQAEIESRDRIIAELLAKLQG